jgi:hypothetical protein
VQSLSYLAIKSHVHPFASNNTKTFANGFFVSLVYDPLIDPTRTKPLYNERNKSLFVRNLPRNRSETWVNTEGAVDRLRKQHRSFLLIEVRPRKTDQALHCAIIKYTLSVSHICEHLFHYMYIVTSMQIKGICMHFIIKYILYASTSICR